MQPSCTLVLAPIRMGSVSPRSTAPYQTLDSSPRWTSPITQAPGATQADCATCGEVSPCGSRLPFSFRSNAASLPCTRCTRRRTFAPGSVPRARCRRSTSGAELWGAVEQRERVGDSGNASVHQGHAQVEGIAGKPERTPGNDGRRRLVRVYIGLGPTHLASSEEPYREPKGDQRPGRRRRSGAEVRSHQGCPRCLFRRSYFHQHGLALAAAGADGRETFSATPATQLVEERRQDPCA